jgi:capsid protein
MKDFGDYEDGQLTRQKLASAYVGFITNKDDIGTDPVRRRCRPRAARFHRDGHLRLRPARRGSDLLQPAQRRRLQGLCAGFAARDLGRLGVPYEALTGDLSNVNFSSGRMGWLEFQRSLAAWQWDMFIPQFCGSVEQWFIDAIEAMGENVAASASSGPRPAAR